LFLQGEVTAARIAQEYLRYTRAVAICSRLVDKPPLVLLFSHHTSTGATCALNHQGIAGQLF